MTESHYTDELIKALLEVGEASDEYRFRSVPFRPDVVYDLGADIGSMSLWAARLWPDATVVAVEPNPDSFTLLVQNVDPKLTDQYPNVTPVWAAVSNGHVYVVPGAEPLHWMAVDRKAPTYSERLVPSGVSPITLAELHARHGGERYVVKMDIEGAEHGVMMAPASRQVLIDSWYFAAELHFWGDTHDKMMAAADDIMRFLFELAQTHTLDIHWYGVCAHVWALRRGIEEASG